MLLIQSVWDGVKTNDRVLYILPDTRMYGSLTPLYLKEFRKTLCLMFKASPSYIVCLFPHSITHLLTYEELYGIEFQEIDSINIFEDNEFKRHFNPNKLYYLNASMNSILPTLTESSLDQVVIDDLNFPKEYFETLKEKNIPYTIGKNYSEEIINSKMYLGKVIQDLLLPLQSPFQQNDSSEESNDYDIVLILGNSLKPSFQEYESILIEYIKACRLTAIYTCDKDLIQTIRSWIDSLKVNIPTHLFPSQWTTTTYPSFIKKIKTHSCRYTSFLWLGEFNSVSKDISSTWVTDREQYKQVSVFDIDAMRTLIQDDYTQDSGYRLTLQPVGLLRSYFELSSQDMLLKENELSSTEE